ncbi:hypothetical protein AB4254_11765 [Vibrio breoganii]
MKVIYFTFDSLMFSHRFRSDNPQLSSGTSETRMMTADERFANAPYDIESAKRLENVAKELGMLIYPLGTRVKRKDLVKHKIFDTAVLAPDIDWRGRLRMDDSNELRMLHAHRNDVEATSWLLIGDIHPEDVGDAFKEHFVQGCFLSGFDEKLAEAIRVRFHKLYHTDH